MNPNIGFLQKLDYYSNNKLLNEESINKVNGLLIALNAISAEEDFYFVFRGETYEAINKKYQVNLNDGNYNYFSQVVFMLGPKGRAFYQEDKGKTAPYFSIEDITNTFYNFIFNELHGMMRKTYDEYIIKFTKENKNFKDFFFDIKNRDIFSKIVSANSFRSQIRIRDYFLIPLHHYHENRFFSNSFLLSTTTDHEVALDFSDDGVVFVGWVPKSYSPFKIAVQDLNPMTKMLQKLNLPIYSQGFHQFEEEVTLKGGLFPHFTLGYIIVKENKFIINHHFFKQRKQQKNIIKNGFSINQAPFREMIRQIKARASYNIDSENNYLLGE